MTAQICVQISVVSGVVPLKKNGGVGKLADSKSNEKNAEYTPSRDLHG